MTKRQRRDEREQKHLVFVLAGEPYAAPLSALREVVADYDVTALPALPAHFRGVMSLRSTFVPVIDLRARFGLPPLEAGDAARRRRVVVLDLEPQPVGLEVDEVLRVATVVALAPIPELPGAAATPFARGLSRLPDGKLVVHLDLPEVVGSTAPLALAALREALDAAGLEGHAEGRASGAAAVAAGAVAGEPAGDSRAGSQERT